MKDICARAERKCAINGGKEKGAITYLPFAQNSFHFRPHHFSKVQVRAVGWEIQRDQSILSQEFANGFDVIRAHIVHNEKRSPVVQLV